MTDESDWDQEPIPVSAEDTIAGRYRLVAPLGQGTFGEVWRAHDRITDKAVAVKLLYSHLELSPARAQIEADVLRRQLPGVVQLKGDGIYRGRAFVVMELVDGSKFPGRPIPCTWEEVRDVTVALLETLAHVHAAFFVHCDLKPENVLVTPEGHVRLLDFGVATQPSGVSTESAVIPRDPSGNAYYSAPEQVDSADPTEAADLYAIGAMLFEALSGGLPHQAPNSGRYLYSKRNNKAIPLRSVAPSVPEPVAHLVDRLLSLSPKDRPQRAADVLAELRGERSIEDPLLPWVGSQDTLLALLAAAREGRSMDVVGPPGSGRSRHLLGVEDALLPRTKVLWVRRPGQGTTDTDALASLGAVVSAEALSRARDLDEAMDIATSTLRALLASGAVLLVDDAHQVDPFTAEVLARSRDAGAILRALPHDGGETPSQPGAPDPAGASRVPVAPLREEDLRSLFAGPDRLLHLRTGAARLLFERTDGNPARVVRELSTWANIGAARRVRNLIAVSHDALDRLALRFPEGNPADSHASALRDLTPDERDTLIWVGIAWPKATRDLLVSVIDKPPYRVDGWLRALQQKGALSVTREGGLLPRVSVPVASWDKNRVRAAHRRVAHFLQPGDPGRLRRLIAARADGDDGVVLVSEALARTERLIDTGKLGEAVAVIESGLRVVSHGAPDAAIPLLALWLEAASLDETPHAMGRVLYAICASASTSPLRRDLESMARALQREDYGPQDTDLLLGLGPFEDRRLEGVRIWALAKQARQRGDERAEEDLLDALRDNVAREAPDLVARLDHCRGRLRYRQGRYLEAAALQRAASEGAQSVLWRLRAKTAGAQALLEAFAYEQARTLAEEAISLAAAHRHAFMEAHATWVLRAIAYRERAAAREAEFSLAPDKELLAAVVHVGGRQIQGAIFFNETAIAWRGRRTAEAIAYARTARDAFWEINEQRGALLMSCLLVALGEPTPEKTAIVLRERAETFPGTGIGIQALALLAEGGKVPAGSLKRARLTSLAQEVDTSRWDAVCDLLSVRECLSRLVPLCA